MTPMNTDSENANRNEQENVPQPPQASTAPAGKNKGRSLPSPPPAPATSASENELPPERQRLKLPRSFDPSKYPHYSVQSSICSLLLSALNMSEHYEKWPGAQKRQRLLGELVRRYQDTCDPLKIRP